MEKKKLGFFKISFQYIFARVTKVKTPRFVPFDANLNHFRWKVLHLTADLSVDFNQKKDTLQVYLFDL